MYSMLLESIVDLQLCRSHIQNGSGLFVGCDLACKRRWIECRRILFKHPVRNSHGSRSEHGACVRVEQKQDRYLGLHRLHDQCKRASEPVLKWFFPEPGSCTAHKLQHSRMALLRLLTLRHVRPEQVCNEN